MKKLLIFSVVFIVACRSVGDYEGGDVLARVYDKYLYASELKDIIPKGTSVKDSLLMTKNFVNNWIREELLLHQAEFNLTDEQKDFSKQLETYRKSLVTYKYETELIRQKLDTIVDQAEIDEYYNANKNNFELNENIARVNFVIFSRDSVEFRKMNRLITSEKPEDREELMLISEVSAINYNFDSDSWITFNELIREIPVKTFDPENYLRNNAIIEISEGDLTYLARILEYRVKHDISPLVFESENIRRIILNKRKTELIRQMETELFNDALEGNHIEIY